MSTLRLQELREAAGLTKTALAQRAGINEKTIRKIEGGSHRPSLTTTLKLAEALDVPVLDLFADRARG